MAIEEYSKVPRSPEVELHHQIRLYSQDSSFYVSGEWGVLSSLQEIQSTYSKFCKQEDFKKISGYKNIFK